MKAISRNQRFEQALGKMNWGTIEEAQAEIECLKEELQSWLDNMPENLQQSSKADELQTAIDELEDINSELNTIIDSIQEQACRTVDFPGMR